MPTKVPLFFGSVRRLRIDKIDCARIAREALREILSSKACQKLHST